MRPMVTCTTGRSGAACGCGAAGRCGCATVAATGTVRDRCCTSAVPRASSARASSASAMRSADAVRAAARSALRSAASVRTSARTTASTAAAARPASARGAASAWRVSAARDTAIVRPDASCSVTSGDALAAVPRPVAAVPRPVAADADRGAGAASLTGTSRRAVRTTRPSSTRSSTTSNPAASPASACTCAVRATALAPPGTSAALVNFQRANNLASDGDRYIEKKDAAAAEKAYAAAEALLPDFAEMSFWHGVALASGGKVDESLPVFAKAYRGYPKFRELVPRLAKVGLLPDDPKVIAKIVAAK